MDIQLALAILFSGVFVSLLLVAIFYFSVVRPRLLTTFAPVDGAGGGSSLAEMQAQLGNLSLQIAEQHKLLLTLRANPGADSPALPDDSGASMAAFYSEQTHQIAAMLTTAEALQEALQAHTQSLQVIAARLDALTERLDQRTAFAPSRLSLIQGIGLTYSGLLHEAGINTFDELARLSPEEVRNLIRPADWQKVDVESWLEQAQLFAAQEAKLDENR